MQTTQNSIEARMRNIVAELRKLRDEIRVQIHLGGMDAKKAWDELEPKLADAERMAGNATEATFRQVVHMLDKVKLFHSTLPEKKRS
jgi:hypothetical protein